MPGQLYPLLYLQTYYLVIQNPMDLSLISKRIEEGFYASAWEYMVRSQGGG